MGVGLELLGSWGFEERRPFIKLFGGDVERAWWQVQIPATDPLVECRERCVEEDYLYRGSQGVGPVSVVISLCPLPDTPVQDDADAAQ